MATKSNTVSQSKGAFDRLMEREPDPFCLYIVALLGSAIFVQGSYHPDQAAWVGLASVVGIVIALVRAKMRAGQVRFPWPCLCLFGVCLCCIISGIVNGLTLTRISAVAIWFTAFAASVMCAQLDAEQKERTLGYAGWVGVLCAIIGILMYSGLLEGNGYVAMDRLQFSLQYANASAALFAAFFMIQVICGSARLHPLAVLSAFALFLTQSFGMILVFAIVFIALMAYLLKKKSRDRSASTLVQAILAAAIYGICLVAGAVWAPVCAVVAVLGSFALCRPIEKACMHRRFPVVFAVACILVCAGACLVAFVVLQGWRADQALSTFVERLVLLRDGWTLLSANPLLGIGPDAFLEQFRYVQTAQYNTGVMHSGYMQLALDGGMLALACFLAFLAISIVALVRMRDVASLLAALCLIVHALIDFDLRFASIMLLLVLLLLSDRFQVALPARLPLAVCSAVLAAVGCACSLVAYGQIQDIEAASDEGDIERIEQAMDMGSFVSDDFLVARAYISALEQAGEYQRIIDYCASVKPEAVLDHRALAVAYYEEGQKEKAQDILIAEVEQQPGNFRLFEYVRFLLYQMDADAETWARYTAAAERANEMATEDLAALMDLKVEIGTVLTEEDEERFAAIERGEGDFSFAGGSL